MNGPWEVAAMLRIDRNALCMITPHTWFGPCLVTRMRARARQGCGRGLVGLDRDGKGARQGWRAEGQSQGWGPELGRDAGRG